MFKIIDSPTKADELQLVGLLWWKPKQSEREYSPDNAYAYEYSPDNAYAYTPPSETWEHHDFAILIEE